MKKQVKKLIYNNDLLFSFYYNIFHKPKSVLERYINDFSKKKKGQIFFIQIGANDGLWNDPIYKYIRRDKWKGILIEPQKEVFNNLKRNYCKMHGLVFENIAISNTETVRKLYKISFTNNRWATGLASFNREDIERMISAGYVERKAKEDNITLPSNKSEWITTEKVCCLPIISLINKHRIENIDLLMIDTEGFDYEIIKIIPFDQIKPMTIVYEFSHFSTEQKEESKNFLIGKGYQTIETESDIIAELK